MIYEVSRWQKKSSAFFTIWFSLPKKFFAVSYYFIYKSKNVNFIIIIIIKPHLQFFALNFYLQVLELIKKKTKIHIQ